MTIKQHESPFHVTHDAETASKMAAEADKEVEDESQQAKRIAAAKALGRALAAAALG